MNTVHVDRRPLRRIGPIAALAAALFAAPAPAAVLVQEAAEDEALSQEAPVGRWEAYAVSSPRSRISNEARAMTVDLAPGDQASFSRVADLAPEPSAILCTFNVSLPSIGSEEATSQVIKMGWDFGTSNGDEAATRTYAELGLVGAASEAGFQLRDRVGGGNSPVFKGTQAVSWVLNNSGRSMMYAAPNGTVDAVGNDRMDVWIGRTRVFDDIPTTNPAGRITDLKWLWSRGSGVTSFDHFEIRTLEEATGRFAPAPGEPSAAIPDRGAPTQEASIALGRPTPNPFTRTMRFAYVIPGGSAAVDIGVYDVAGRRIRALARGVQTTGQYEAVWDGLADNGARVRYGMYFLRASIGAERSISRVVYLHQ